MKHAPDFSERPRHAHRHDRLRHLQGHLRHRSHAAGVVRRQPHPEVSRLRGRPRPRPGEAEDHPAGGLRRNPQARQGRSVRLREAEEGDRAHRLSGAAGGVAARQALQGRPRRMVPLGRHHAGHHRHRHHHADPRGARDHREGHRRHLRRARGARQEIPRHADGRPQQSAAGGADHLRLQGARPTSPPSSATSSG